MKRQDDDFDATLRRHAGQFRAPSPAQLDASRERIRERLARALPSLVTEAPQMTRTRSSYAWRLGFAAVGVASIIALAGTTPWRAAALATIADGSLYVGTERQLLQRGRAIDAGQLVRSNGGQGGVIELADDSRIEMQSKSELLLERAEDGVRIHLHTGGIIVNAAKQPNGHLYVQTKDVSVSVVGTVFLVNAGEQGSRVAVIEGEVRVQQGTTETTLLSGEQVTTNPLMEAPPVSREISWSRNAEKLRARLQESARPAVTPQPVREALVFEEASVRPTGVTVRRGGRGGGSRSLCSELFLDSAPDGSLIFRVQIDPRRFAVLKTTLYTLIAWAHGKNCDALRNADLITGGPAWVGSDEWDIQALIPVGAPSYTVRQFVDGSAPDLQARLRNLLTQRFGLGVRTAMRAVTAYVLTTGPGPLKLRPRLEPTGPGAFTGRTDEFGGRYGVMMNVPESNFAGMLMLATNRLVLDRTGLKEGYYLDLEFAAVNGGGTSKPSLFKALEEVGLKLEEATVPLESFVIERAERPTEN
jgi:uncharacterized protein (TIGR03435 family)